MIYTFRVYEDDTYVNFKIETVHAPSMRSALALVRRNNPTGKVPYPYQRRKNEN